MNPPIPSLEPGLQIGDYVLISQLEAQDHCQVWLGKQVSVKREVEVVCYYGPDPEGFLADVRVKARVEDGVLGLVYEAIPTEGLIAFAREVLPEKSLTLVAKQGLPLLPVEVTRIIFQVAGTLKSLEKRGIAYENFAGTDIRLGADNAVRIQNIAKDGPALDDGPSRRALAEVLRTMLKVGQPGATRMGTLLEYIEGTPEQSAIPWSQAEELAHQVDGQLSVSDVPVTRTTPVMESRRSFRVIMTGGLICGLVAVLLGIFVFQEDKPDFEPGLVIAVPAGRYPLPNGGVAEMEAFRIDAGEVTIGEYSEFMIAWQMMDPDERSALWPPDKPEDKINIRPLDWNTYFPLARSQNPWKERPMSLDCPVVGVDWWDARTYANWKQGRLPTEQEWWAANNSGKVATEQPPLWGPVGDTDEKIYGLGGNVSEWSGEYSKNPAFPIQSPKPVVLGGSFTESDQGGLHREWVDSPTTRRDNLGFRLVYPVEQF